ncbi:hypothetical protein RMATCC62417_09062 [Rhizopus microsporus]|nr:hypothetical protein RMATCC62417_09062 [Rhizopus microsporus]
MSHRNEIYPGETTRISSKADLDREMKRIKKTLLKTKMTEENWDLFNKAMKNIATWCTEYKIHEYIGFIDHIKELKELIVTCLTSERTILSKTAIDLLTTLSQHLGTKFETINNMMLPTIKNVFGRSSKVHVNRTVEGYKQIIQHSLLPRTIPEFCSILSVVQRQDPRRLHLADCLEVLIRVNTEDRIKKYKRDIESALKVMAVDANLDVRRLARACFESYKQKLPEQAQMFTQTLTKDVKKNLIQPSTVAPPTTLNGVHPKPKPTSAAPSTTSNGVHTKPKPTSASKPISNKPTSSSKAMQPPSTPIFRYRPISINLKERVLKIQANQNKDIVSGVTFRNGRLS